MKHVDRLATNSSDPIARFNFFIIILLTLSFTFALLPRPAHAQGTIICVSPTGDYATIQAAVDVAADGDEIRVASGVYAENVIITKTLTLSGQWLNSCEDLNAGQESVTAITVEQGRAATIDPDRTGVTVSMARISLVGGNATGLGGAIRVDPGAGMAHSGAEAPASAFAATAARVPDDWQAQIAQMAAQGAVPGGASPAEVMTRVEALMPAALAAPTLPEAYAIAPAGVTDEVDCGGALYARNVGLTLQDVTVGQSVASTTGDGYGGGACIIDPSADGTTLTGGQFIKNTGSVAGTGMGGALFIQGGPAGSVTLENMQFFYNYGSVTHAAYGGALAMIDVPQPTLTGDEADHRLETCHFAFNVGSKGASGTGGGAFLLRTPDAHISNCRFFANYASSGGADAQYNASSGYGGGLYVERAPQLLVEQSTFDFNVAQTSAPELNRRAEGGGAYVLASAGATLADNVFDRNIAGFSGQGYGGGLAVFEEERINIHDNEFTENWANVVNFIGSAGGGLFVAGITDSTIITNTFTGNVTNMLGQPGLEQVGSPPILGGGMAMEDAQRVAVIANQFTGNVAAVGGSGFGGGLALIKNQGVDVMQNEFTRNLAVTGARGDGLGGAAFVNMGQGITLMHNTFTENSGTEVTQEDPSRATSALALFGTDLQTGGDSPILLFDVVVDRNYILHSGRNLPVATPPNNLAISVEATDRFTITNNVIAGSTLGGILAIYKSYVDADEQLFETHGAVRNNTLYANGTYGLWLLSRWRGDTLSVENNVIVGHSYGVDGMDLYGAGPTAVALDYTLFHDNGEDIGPDAGDTITSTHTVVGDPLFVAPENDNFRVWPNSPAVDAGNPAGVPPAPPMDIERTLRPQGPRVDIGAYEWHGRHVFLPRIVD